MFVGNSSGRSDYEVVTRGPEVLTTFSTTTNSRVTATVHDALVTQKINNEITVPSFPVEFESLHT